MRACIPRVSQSAQSPIAAPFRFPLSSHMFRAQLTALTGPSQGSQEYPLLGSGLNARLSPAAAAIGAEVADLESLIAERSARASNLGAAIETCAANR